MLRRALSPELSPWTKRPPATCCMASSADAVTAGWRVIGFDTVIPSRGAVVWAAAYIIVTSGSAHSDCESPVVSRSNPDPSARRSQSP